MLLAVSDSAVEKEAEVIKNHAALVFGKTLLYLRLPCLHIELHRNFFGHPVVGDTGFVVLTCPRIRERKNLVWVNA